MLGTNPSDPDTDGDGVDDFNEIYHYKTSPVETNSISGQEIESPALINYNAENTTASWQIFDGGLLGSSFRGKIEWSFNVPTDGWWMIELGGRLRGELRDLEILDLGVEIDGKALAGQQMRFLHGQPSALKIVTPHLAAGTYTLKVDIRNEIGRRTFQILSLKMAGVGGFDGDMNSRPDWLDAILAESNTLSPVAPESVVSPLFIEGSTRHVGGAEVISSTHSVIVQRGLGDNHWYADVPLDPIATTSLSAVLEGRTLSQEVDWVRWNSLGGVPLVIRVGDSVKIGAWTSPEDSADVSITVDGQTESLTAAGSLVKTFTSAGVYPITVTSNGVSQICCHHYGNGGGFRFFDGLLLGFSHMAKVSRCCLQFSDLRGSVYQRGCNPARWQRTESPSASLPFGRTHTCRPSSGRAHCGVGKSAHGWCFRRDAE